MSVKSAKAIVYKLPQEKAIKVIPPSFNKSKFGPRVNHNKISFSWVQKENSNLSVKMSDVEFSVKKSTVNVVEKKDTH